MPFIHIATIHSFRTSMDVAISDVKEPLVSSRSPSLHST